jgi:hypothetical protein
MSLSSEHVGVGRGSSLELMFTSVILDSTRGIIATPLIWSDRIGLSLYLSSLQRILYFTTRFTNSVCSEVKILLW